MADVMPRSERIGLRADAARVAAWVAGDLHGHPVLLAGVTTDSRRVRAGSLFVALRGPNHDGHDHAAAAVAAGATALLVERRLDVAVPQIVVADSRLALGRLGAAWRLQLGLPLVAVTGSNGKTTVKEMTAAILGRIGRTFATGGNLNNDIGVPLTLLSLEPEDRFAVVEMGASHPGEIAYLTGLAQPDAALVNNAGPAHLEGFGSLEGVARAKGEVFTGLPADGTAVVNADDRFAALWRELAGARRILGFGLRADADVRATVTPVDGGQRLQLTTPAGAAELLLPLPGEHNARNALAAAALALAVGAPLAAVVSGLEAMAPVPGRLQVKAGRGGARIIDDSYNANPASLAAGIAVLAAQPGRRVLALGDMAELGGDAAALHREAGGAAKAQGIDALYGAGPLSRSAADAFGAGGRAFESAELLAEALGAELDRDTTVLVKGSRSARMERVVTALLAEGN